MRRAEKPDYLIQVAERLFNERGYHAVGVDQIVAEAGMAKTTLYRHFSSKEALIVAVLRKMDEEFRFNMRKRVLSIRHQEPILSTFDFLADWFEQTDFHGCPFICALKEFCDTASIVHHEAATHKRLMLAYFEELMQRERSDNTSFLANSINLLHEGAISIAHAEGSSAPALVAKRCAKLLLSAPKDHPHTP